MITIIKDIFTDRETPWWVKAIFALVLAIVLFSAGFGVYYALSEAETLLDKVMGLLFVFLFGIIAGIGLALDITEAD